MQHRAVKISIAFLGQRTRLKPVPAVILILRNEYNSAEPPRRNQVNFDGAGLTKAPASGSDAAIDGSSTAIASYRGQWTANGGESVSQSPLMYKLFFIPARGNLRSWLPAISLSRVPASAIYVPPTWTRPRSGHLRRRRRCSQDGEGADRDQRFPGVQVRRAEGGGIERLFSRSASAGPREGCLVKKDPLILLFILPN
jgi:hypothetical protein